MNDQLEYAREMFDTVALDPADFAIAREQAAARGVDVQTFVSDLIHTELMRQVAILRESDTGILPRT